MREEVPSPAQGDGTADQNRNLGVEIGPTSATDGERDRGRTSNDMRPRGGGENGGTVLLEERLVGSSDCAPMQAGGVDVGSDDLDAAQAVADAPDTLRTTTSHAQPVGQRASGPPARVVSMRSEVPFVEDDVDALVGPLQVDPGNGGKTVTDGGVR